MTKEYKHKDYSKSCPACGKKLGKTGICRKGFITPSGRKWTHAKPK